MFLPTELTLKELCNDAIFRKHFTIDVDAVLNLTAIKSKTFSEMLFLFSPNDIKALQFIPAILSKGGTYLMIFNNGLSITFKNKHITFTNSSFMREEAQ